jgi:protein TonB
VVKKEPPKPKPKPSPKPKPKKELEDILNPLSQPLDESFGQMIMASATTLYSEKPITSDNTAPRGQNQKRIDRLYGSEFNSYSPQQKEYIKQSLDSVQQITQNTLTLHGYPEMAKQNRQTGTNIVSFYLHPNGDISDVTLKHAIGYEALDSNTLEVIQKAYKKYPLPNEKTRLIFNVNYSLY